MTERTDWRADLWNLLTEVDPNPVEDIVGSGAGQVAVGALTSDPADYIFKTLDLPASVARGTVGSGINLLQGEGLHGIEQGQQQWDQSIQDFRESDLGPFGILKTPLEIAANVAVDPLTYAGFGLAGKGAQGLRGAANEAALAGRLGVSQTLRGAAYPLQATQTLNDLPGQLILPPVQAGVRQVGRGVTRMWPEALSPSATSLRRTRRDDLDNIANQMSSGTAQNPNRPFVPKVERIETASVPPVMPTPHPPTSAPTTIQSGMRESWRRLREAMFDPRIGIVPGGPGRSGQIDPLWRRPEDVVLTERVLTDMANIGAGIMQTITDSGGIMPGLIRASAGMDQVQAEIVGKYGAGIQPYLPSIHGRIRQKLTADGFDADAMMPSSRFLLPYGWANGIVDARRMTDLSAQVKEGTLTREEALEQLRQGGTQRGNPEAIEGAASMGAAFLSLMQEGGDDLFRKFRAGDPDSVWFPDEEPLTGAVGLVPTGFRDALWDAKLGEGPLRMSQAHGSKVLEALGIGSTFGDTRQAWNQYMRGTFGELRDDELEVLSEMTTDVLYQAYVNAANQVSGNSRGAAALAANTIRDDAGAVIGLDPAALRKPDRRPAFNADGTPKLDRRGRQKREDVPETGGPLAGLHHTKISAMPTEPGDIGGEAAQAVIRGLDVGERRDEVAEWYRPFSSSSQRKPVSGTAGKIPQIVLWGEQLRLIPGANLTKLPTEEDVSRILGKTRKLNANSIRDAIRALGEAPLNTSNTGTGGMLPGLTELQKIIEQGQGLGLSTITREAKNWYKQAAKEVESIVGVGNYEDATFLLDVIGITSASTEVSENADLALRVLAEWKMGRDDTLKARFNIDAAQFEEVRKSNLLRTDFQSGHRTKIANAINEYAARRKDPRRMPVQVEGGPKTWDYAGSFMATLWRDQIGKALEGSPALQSIRQALDDALALFTVDRHMSRIDAGPTDVAGIEYMLLRERGNLTAKTMKLSPEEAQAAGWYWVRDRQGYLREIRGDSDLAYALRDKIEEAWGMAEPKAGEPGQQTSKTWDELKEMVRARGDVAEGEETEAIYNLVRQEIFYRLLKRSFDKPEVKAALREANLPDSLEGMQRDILAVVQRQAASMMPQDLPLYSQDPEGMAPSFNAPEDLAYKQQREAQLLAAKLTETDVTNRDSLYARKIKQPVMEIYADSSIKRTMKEAAGADIKDLNIPDWPDRATGYGGLGMDSKLTLQQNEFLGTKLKDGKTYQQFIKKEAAQADIAIRALREANITWGAYATPAERLAAVGDNPKLRDIVDEWNKREVDLLAARDGNQVAVHLLDDLIDKEEGVKRARPTHYDMFKAIWTEQVLMSGKYHTGNLFGGWIANMLAGNFGNPFTSTREVWKALKMIRAGGDQISRAEISASLKGTQIAQEYGLDEMPAEVVRGGIRALHMGESDFGPSAIGTAVGRLTRNETLGRKAGWLPTANNDMALAVDTGVRSPLWGQTFKDAMEEMLPSWESEVRRRGAKFEGFQFSRREGINAPPSYYADDLKQHFVELGFQPGEAERLMRDYVEIRGMALAKAKAKLGEVHFYLERTNLDEKIGKIVPFHYYASRAIRYYGEEAVRNPALVLNYLRLADGMEDAEHDPGLSARQKGFIRLMGTAMGFTLLMNPDALFAVVKVFGLNDTYDPDGQTQMGGVLDNLKQRGIGLYPWIDGTINLMGMYGNTFEPDLLGIRHKALVGGAVQFVRAHLGYDPAGAPYAAAMGNARYAVSSFVSDVMPWLSEPVTPRAGGSSQEAALDTIIESVVIEANPNLTNQELLDIMSDPDSPEYEAAYRTVADAGIVTQLLNFTAPVRFTMRHDATDVRRAQLDQVQQEADRLGVAPWEIAPTEDDLEFNARYEAHTGKKYEVGDYESAKLAHDLSRAPLEAKALIVAEAEYNVIGTPKQRRHYEAYMDLLGGNDPRSAHLSEVGRRELANQYLDRTRGAAEAVDEMFLVRDDFVQSHPEFAEFKSWQGKMGDLKTQLGGNLSEYRRQASQQNPNAARYFAEQDAYIKGKFPEERWADELDRITMNANAFQSITGKPQLRSIQGPVPGVMPADVTLPVMQPAGQDYGFTGNAMSKELARIGANAGIRNMGSSY